MIVPTTQPPFSSCLVSTTCCKTHCPPVPHTHLPALRCLAHLLPATALRARAYNLHTNQVASHSCGTAIQTSFHHLILCLGSRVRTVRTYNTLAAWHGRLTLGSYDRRPPSPHSRGSLAYSLVRGGTGGVLNTQRRYVCISRPCGRVALPSD